MKITIMGHDTMSFLKALDEEGIPYAIHRQRSGLVTNSAGEVIVLAGAVAALIPWAALTKAAVAWLKVKEKRQFCITTKANKVVNVTATGFTAEEISALLQEAKDFMVIAPDKPERKVKEE